VQAGEILEIPLIVTEHYPEKLGKTVPQVDVKHAAGIYSKTKFSMIIPEIEEKLKKMKEVDSVILMGLEVNSSFLFRLNLLNSQRFSVPHLSRANSHGLAVDGQIQCPCHR
jgi:hypothetical protein